MNDIWNARNKVVKSIMDCVDKYVPRNTEGHDEVRQVVMDSTELFASRMERLFGTQASSNGRDADRAGASTG